MRDLPVIVNEREPRPHLPGHPVVDRVRQRCGPGVLASGQNQSHAFRSSIGGIGGLLRAGRLIGRTVADET